MIMPTPMAEITAQWVSARLQLKLLPEPKTLMFNSSTVLEPSSPEPPKGGYIKAGVGILWPGGHIRQIGLFKRRLVQKCSFDLVL